MNLEHRRETVHRALEAFRCNRAEEGRQLVEQLKRETTLPEYWTPVIEAAFGFFEQAAIARNEAEAAKRRFKKPKTTKMQKTLQRSQHLGYRVRHDEPLCLYCEAPATQIDHNPAVRVVEGDSEAFLGERYLDAICRDCNQTISDLIAVCETKRAAYVAQMLDRRTSADSRRKARKMRQRLHRAKICERPCCGSLTASQAVHRAENSVEVRKGLKANKLMPVENTREA